MKARILASVLILGGLFVTADRSYACGGGGGNRDPVAVLTLQPEYVKVGRTVIFDGSGSYDPDGYIVKYEWDFNYNGSSFDPNYYETSSHHPDGKFDGITTHAYGSPGTYTVKLRVTDNGSPGLTDDTTYTVYVGRVFNITDSLSYNDIQSAIDGAGPNDVIKVYPGRYIENIDFNDVKITLTSIDAGDPEVVAATIIDGDANGSVVTFGSGDANSVITGFTITNGEADNGGGINCNGVSPEISNCVIADNNSSNYGGGMYCTGSASQPTITNCVFIENTTRGSNNGYGGGIYSNGSASPTVASCFFSKNSAYSAGGGLANNNSSPTVVNCVFSKNDANDGGGIYDCNSSPTIRNCTFNKNHAGSRGGGIFNETGSPGIVNCIFWDDEAGGDGNEIYPLSGLNVTSCDVRGGYTGAGNINSNPLFVNSGALASLDGVYGSRDDGLFLRTVSDCIDAGSNDAVDPNFDTDIIGNNRIADSDHTGEAIVDMGAYEIPMIWYVDISAPPDDGDGSEWGDYAYDDLQDALTNASVKDGNEIWVADGNYMPTAGSDRSVSFELIEGVAVYGGFAGDETSLNDRSWLNNETILNGDINNANDDDSYHVVTGADGAVLDGFTITGGNANSWPSYSRGGGIYCDGTSPTISNCMITGNNAYGYGGGMYCTNSAPTVIESVFSENDADFGGGVSSHNSSLTFIDCVIADNDSLYGGGMINEGGSPKLTNCVFSGNTTDEQGGGMYNDNSCPIITNCTFTGNTACLSGGMHNCQLSSPIVTNCIFWGNEADIDGNEIYNSSSNPVFGYCDIKDSGGSSNWNPNFGVDVGGNIDSDPCFTDPNNPDGPDGLFMTIDDGLRLIDNGFITNNLCVDAADGYAALSTDIRGLGRIDIYDVNNTGTGEPNYADIGAYENQWGLYPLYDMEVNSVTKDGGTITIVTTGATYVLDSDGMDMYRRIDPNINDVNERKVAELTFEQNIGSLSIDFDDERRAIIESSKARFDFYSESFFLVTAKDSLVYDHNSLIDASWNAPLDGNYGYIDRMWTDGYGGSLHAKVSGSPNADVVDVNYTTISMSAGDAMGHMVFPPKLFDFEGLYGKDANGNDVRPFVHYVSKNVMNQLMQPNGMVPYIQDSFGIFVLGDHIYDNGMTPTLLDSGIMGYNVADPNRFKIFVELAHQNGFRVGTHITHPSHSTRWKYPQGHPKAGQKQDVAVILQWMREFKAEYDLDGWYLDNANAGGVMDDYSYIRQVRNDVGDDGFIYHHDSVDVWDEPNTWPYDPNSYTGLRAVFINAYVNYTLTGETGGIAEVDSPNDEYFRYFTGSYGLSQAYSSHMRRSTQEAAVSWEETWRVLGQNLNGCQINRWTCWVTHFKPVYDIRKAEYLNDVNVPFVPDVDWPIDTNASTGGWFRDPANINVTDVNDANTTFTITWTTPDVNSDSAVAYTSTGVWWPPDGSVYDANMVIGHSITLIGLDPAKFDSYEFRIRSTNDTNDPPAVPGEVIWGYVDYLKEFE